MKQCNDKLKEQQQKKNDIKKNLNKKTDDKARTKRKMKYGRNLKRLF